MFEAIIYAVVVLTIIGTMLAMFFSKNPTTLSETKTTVLASTIKIGDRIMTPRGEAVVRRTQVQKVSIPKRVEESVVMGVNYSTTTNGDEPTKKWTLGHDNVQVWTHDRVTKIVPPGAWAKTKAFFSQV